MPTITLPNTDTSITMTADGCWFQLGDDTDAEPMRPVVPTSSYAYQNGGELYQQAIDAIVVWKDLTGWGGIDPAVITARNGDTLEAGNPFYFMCGSLPLPVAVKIGIPAALAFRDEWEATATPDVKRYTLFHPVLRNWVGGAEDGQALVAEAQ